MNNRDKLTIEQLNNDVLLYLFSFFNYKELMNNRLVSRTFKFFSETSINTHIQQTANQLFYTVGNPILISSPRSVKDKFINKLIGVGYDMLFLHFRQRISTAEIKASFPSQEVKIKLFKSEQHAMAYSRSLRLMTDHDNYDGQKVYQPAIFKVQYLGKLKPEENKQETLIIYPHDENDYFENELHIDVEYFETAKNTIIPHLGSLKIELNKQGIFKEYSSVHYQPKYLLNNNPTPGILSRLVNFYSTMAKP